ncbi:MAG: hypothetical protein GY940_38810, partial [bacterium]|nr:hypothetical protein [bacterium]
DSLDHGQLQDYLGRFLTHYMIPSHFISMEKLPLTPSGKIDMQNLKRLADSQKYSSSTINETYVPPGNDIETTLVNIWQEVLGIERIGIKDHFFQLGGHSLTAARAASRIYKELSVRISFRDIFETPTIAGLARLVKQKEAVEFTGIQPAPGNEDHCYNVSNSQRRLWILNQFEAENIAYNMPSVFRIKGDLDMEALENAFRVLVQRHESLRTIFTTAEGVPKQRIHQ